MAEKNMHKLESCINEILLEMSPAVVAPPEKPGGTVVLADKTSVELVPARAPTVALGPLTAVAHVVVAVGAIVGPC